MCNENSSMDTPSLSIPTSDEPQIGPVSLDCPVNEICTVTLVLSVTVSRLWWCHCRMGGKPSSSAAVKKRYCH